MKVQILTTHEKQIEGYEKYFASSDLSQISVDLSDNECSFILAPELLSDIPIADYGNTLKILLSKLRMQGELVVGGVELNAFADAVTDSQTEDSYLISVIENCKSMAKVKEICQLIESFGNYKLTWSCNGIRYEIKAQRA